MSSLFDSLQCPACLKVFNTIAGRNSHTAQVKSCNEFLKTQLHELVDNLEQEHDAMDIDDEEDSHDGSHLQEPSPWIPMDHHEDELILLPEPDDQSPVPPSGSSTNQQTQGNLRPITLDDNEDTRHIVEHPTAGRIFSHHANPLGTDIASDNVYTPFSSELDWKVAEWAVKDRVGNNSFDRLLDIPGVVEKLGLSYKNIQNLHGVVDSFSERAGDWKTQTLSFDDRPDETFTIRYRCPVEAIKSLWADPNNQEHLVFAPKKVYSDETKENRIYNEMWTGQWWHVLQSRIPQGGTVAPVILATDKTQLTQFSGNKSAYPVYLTIGNLPKAIRRKPSKNACILIGYLSVQKFDRSSMTELEHRSRMQRAFHQSMKIILEPLIKAGKEGVQMRSSNGDVRLVFPILSCYVADYPEQCLVACSKYGTCPKCRQTANHLADLDSTIPPRTNQWTKSIIQDAQKNASGSMNSFSKACMEHDVAGGVYEPFWKDFPHSDIHKAITPDILHQIYQGLFKHVVEWCQMAVGTKELDRRIRTLPLGYGLRRFKNGISGLSQISGSERKNMAKILLACVHNLMTAKGIKAIRALIDFIFLAQYETHDNNTLGYLQDALNSFHENKSYFIEVDARKHLNLPKLHSISHYIQCIKLFGTTDNYNTEMFERLHIDFAKQGWRASNQRDEFPQMIQWLSRQEKITAFKLLVSHRLSFSHARPKCSNIPPSSSRPPIAIAKRPQIPNRPITVIERLHNAPEFAHTLKLFLNTFLADTVPVRDIDYYPLPIQKLNIYTNFRFRPTALQDEEADEDIVRALPISQTLPCGRFDTVIYMDNEEAESTGLEGTRVGRVKVIFSLPSTIEQPGYSMPAPTSWPTGPLAYIELYSKPATTAHQHHGMYPVTPWQGPSGNRRGAIISLTNIRQSCMLVPVFPKPGAADAQEFYETWTYENVLDKAKSFVINNHLNMYSYQTIY